MAQQAKAAMMCPQEHSSEGGVPAGCRCYRSPIAFDIAKFLLIATFYLSGCHRDAAISPSARESSRTSPASSESASAELLVYGKVPSFQLTDQSGEIFDSSELNGQVYLTTFFFTTCPTTCPQQSRELSALQDIDGLAMISITVQPNVDSPEVLFRYSKQYKADLSRWHFLTGARDQIWELSQKGFMLPVGDTPEPGDMPIFHSSKIILVDRNQQIRGFYESQSRSEMAKLRADAKQLLDESDEGESQQSFDEEDDELSELEGSLKGAFQSADSADSNPP